MTIPNNDEHREARRRDTHDRVDKYIASQPPECRDKLLLIESKLRELEDAGISFHFHAILGEASGGGMKGFSRESFSLNTLKNCFGHLFRSCAASLDMILGKGIFVSIILADVASGTLIDRYESDPKTKNVPPSAAPKKQPSPESTDSPHGPL